MRLKTITLAILVCFLLPLPAVAEGPWGYFRIPDLSQEQKARMDALWMAWLREKMLLRAALKQAKVDLRVRLSSEVDDQASLQEAIQRIASIKTQILENDVKFVLAVKKLLKPEQLQWFNLDMLGKGRYSDQIIDPDAEIGPMVGPGGPPTGPGGPQGFGPPPPGPQGPACPIQVPPEQEQKKEPRQRKAR